MNNRRSHAIAPIALLTTLAAAGEMTICTSPALPIADAAPGSPTIVQLVTVLPPGATIETISIELEITHPWLGDLTATLARGPAQVTLFDRIGLAGYPFGCGGNDMLATFTDTAAAPPDLQCAPGIVPNITGQVLPFTPLAPLLGPVGTDQTWTLTLADAAPFDTGTLHRVCLTLTYSAPACSPADLTTTGSTNGLPDGTVNGSDFTYYLALFAASDTNADLTTTGSTNGLPDGAINGSDFTYYLSLFAAGCP